MYTTLLAIQDEVGGARRLIEALDDDGVGKMDADMTALVGRICQRASDSVDSFLSGRYVVPLNPVPKLATEAALIFACEIIFNRRRQANDEKNPYTTRAEDFRGQLKAISDRKESLDAKERPAFTPGAIIGRCSSLEGSSL